MVWLSIWLGLTSCTAVKSGQDRSTYCVETASLQLQETIVSRQAAQRQQNLSRVLSSNARATGLLHDGQAISQILRHPVSGATMQADQCKLPLQSANDAASSASPACALLADNHQRTSSRADVPARSNSSGLSMTSMRNPAGSGDSSRLTAPVIRPLLPTATAARTTASALAGQIDRLGEMLTGTTSQAATSPPPASRASVPPVTDNPLALLMHRLDQLQDELDRAFSGIDPAHVAPLRTALIALLDRSSTGSELSDGPDGDMLLQAINAVHAEALRQVARLLLMIAADDFIDALLLQAAGLDNVPTPDWAQVKGQILYAEDNRHGPILIGGPGNNSYSGEATVIIDTGGADSYTLQPSTRLRIIIDRSGNDHYIGTTFAQIGAAVFGASMLVDLAGNDRYSGAMISQGAAVLGVGIVIDLQGDDRYSAGELAQGAALAGIGLHLDSDGDDSYSAAKFAQGYGGARGIGWLLDLHGNDHYLAGRKHASSYGTPGRYQAFAQGVGMGFRNSIAGGIGVLQDAHGDDRYEGGNFAQGVGYFLGIGQLLDDQGDDQYHGGRYSQGAAAHLGAGLLLDRAGNDRYSGAVSANQGAAWDLAVAALLDCQGDDHYQASEFALGAGDENAFGVLLDLSGNDHYQAHRDAFGYAGKTDYRADGEVINNIGLFIDAGGGDDSYHAQDRNRHSDSSSRLGIFSDQ
jgi:hypothetical protein